MIIYFTGLNSSYVKYTEVLSSIESLKKIFPELLHGQKFTYCSEDKKNFILLLCSPKGRNEVRIYFAENKEHILFYSGLPVDISKKITAHDSKDLLNNFDQIKYEYEGQASIIRYNKESHDADIITDILGMEQVYYYNLGGELLLSNYVKLIEITSPSYKIDLAGASLFLSLGWVGDKYTLSENIHVIKGGEHWRWENDKKSIIKKVYFNPKEFKPASKEVLNKRNIDNLYKEMEDYLQLLSESFDFECALTGGYDSRLVAALLLDKNLKADYYTAGNPENDDIIIASMIASKYNLSYRVYEIDYDYLFNNWDALVRTLILQNNGMSSLWQIFNLLTHLDSDTSNNCKSKVRLSTQGAETSRAAYNRTFIWDKKISQKDVYIYMTNRTLTNSNFLLTDLSIELFYKFFNSFFKSLNDEGTNYRLAPDLFYVCERVGRHHANHLRINKTSADIFSIFSTKAYMKAALQVHPVDKITYPIHYKIMKKINRELFEIPTSYGKWPLQSRITRHFLNTFRPLIRYLSRIKPANMAETDSDKKKVLFAYDRILVLETKLNEIRNICFENTGSDLWQLINRKKLEELLTAGSEIQQKGLPQLFNIATLFYYEQLGKSN